MEPSKQKSIMHFFQKKPNSENLVSGFNMTEEETTTSDLQHGLKRSCNNNMDHAEKSKREKGDFIRQYDSKYLEFGFTIAPSSEKVPLPMCLVCAKILSNDAMKPSKLTRHFHSLHSNLVGKPLAYFKRLLSETENERIKIKKMTKTDKDLLKSSYLIALLISKTKKPFTIGEDLIKPCMLAAATEVLGPEQANKLKAIPLSNDSIKRRILDMAVDVEQQVIEQVKQSRYFAIQLDESTDLSNCAILSCFVRYETEESIIDEFLCCLQLHGRTRPVQKYFGLLILMCKSKV
ncbi:SCAN domain-containing protein 3-like [Ciona intestinalis]